MGVTIRCSLFLWTSSFSLPFSLNVVPAPVFSGVVLLISSQNHIPFRRSFSCNRQNKKADTQKHQKSAGALLSLQNDVLCNGLEIQRRDCWFIRSLADSTKKHRVQKAVFSLSISQALGGLHRIPNLNILYSVVTSFKKSFIIPKPYPKIKFLVRFCIVFAKAGYAILLHYLSNALLSANIC